MPTGQANRCRGCIPCLTAQQLGRRTPAPDCAFRVPGGVLPTPSSSGCGSSSFLNREMNNSLANASNMGSTAVSSNVAVAATSSADAMGLGFNDLFKMGIFEGTMESWESDVVAGNSSEEEGVPRWLKRVDHFGRDRWVRRWPRKYNPETKKNERYNFPGWLEWLEPPPPQYRPMGTMDEEMAEAVSNLRLDDIAADTNRENDNVPADNNREDEEDPSDDDMGVDDDFDDGYAGDKE